MDFANWEEWWLPNSNFNADSDRSKQSDVDSAESDSDYFSYIISPDCNSCAVSNNDKGNALSFFNTDEYGDRTGYYMTGTMFGCLTTHKALKDCSWDYDTYECVMCTIQESDQDLGYHVVHHYDDDEKHWEEQCAANDYFWGYLQVSTVWVTI